MWLSQFRLIVVVALFAVLSPASAQDYPNRQIMLIAPWPAGGAIDALSRTLAPRLTDRLGKTVVVENRPGAGSIIGTAAGAKAAPDGYTMVMAGSAIARDHGRRSTRSCPTTRPRTSRRSR